MDRPEKRKILGGHRNEEPQQHFRDSAPYRRSGCGQNQCLGQELTSQPGAAGSQRRTNCQLTFPVCTADHQQPSYICATDQQHG